VEAILGLRLDGGRIAIDPCLPPGWEGFDARLHRPAGTLAIRVDDPERIGRGQVEMTIDGAPHTGNVVAFPTDGSVRRVVVRLHPAVEPGDVPARARPAGAR
jgi:cyclic beta-1,2-glucan synthetase